MVVEQLRFQLHNKLLAMRAIQRITNTPLFQELYNSLPDYEREEIVNKIYENDINYIKQFINRSRICHLETMTITQLRERAKQLGVKYYLTKTKFALMSEITEMEGSR